MQLQHYPLPGWIHLWGPGVGTRATSSALSWGQALGSVPSHLTTKSQTHLKHPQAEAFLPCSQNEESCWRGGDGRKVTLGFSCLCPASAESSEVWKKQLGKGHDLNADYSWT